MLRIRNEDRGVLADEADEINGKLRRITGVSIDTGVLYSYGKGAFVEVEGGGGNSDKV